jgi:hypothetical protein
MSKGNPVVLVRFTPEELLAIDSVIKSTVQNSKKLPFSNRSEFVRYCVSAEMKHRQRSRKSIHIFAVSKHERKRASLMLEGIDD